MVGVPAVITTRHLPNKSLAYLYAYFLSKCVEHAQNRVVSFLYDTNRSHELRKVHTLTVFCALRDYVLLLYL
jgi:hypothetical protein